MADGDAPPVDDAHHELLRRRAAALARVPYRGRAGTAVDMILFSLGDERFAIPAACVLQVAVLKEFTPLPGAPPPLFGVTHWRGEVLTILDLRELLGVRVHGLTDLGRVLVIDGPDRLFGIVADAVSDMKEINSQDVRPLPEDGSGGSLLRGATREGLLVIDSTVLLRRFGAAGGHATA